MILTKLTWWQLVVVVIFLKIKPTQVSRSEIDFQFMGMQYCSKKVSFSDKALLVVLLATSLLITI